MEIRRVLQVSPTGLVRVMLIDGDLLVRRSLVRVLAQHFEVIALANASEAVDLLAVDTLFDAVICDRYLDGTPSAPDLYDRLRERWPHLAERMIVISGLPPSNDAFGRALAERWLEQPVRTGDVIALIRQLIEPEERVAA